MKKLIERATSCAVINLSLDVAYRMHRRFVALEQRAWSESLSLTERHERDAAHQIEAGALIAHDRWLRSKLRRFPFWSRGHLALATVSLRRNDIAAAHASALAALKLAPTGPLAREARIALARAHLRQGDAARAIEFFTAALSEGDRDLGVIEDLAAAHLLQGDFTRTVELLEAIPGNARSAEAIAALRYAVRQRDGVADER